MAQYIYLRNGQTKIIPGTKGGLRSRIAVVDHFIVYQKETALNVWADCGGHGDPDNAIVTGGQCRMGVRDGNWCVDIELQLNGFITDTEDTSWKCVHEVSSYWTQRYPQDLILNYVSPTSYKLDWENNGTGFQGISIERATESGSFSQLTTVLSTVRTYTDETAEVGIKYSYRLRYYSGSSYSAYSNTVTNLVGDYLSGMVGEWLFNENDGSTANDNISTNNGTIVGAEWVAGKSGSALSFDGVSGNDSIDLGDVLDGTFVGASAKFTLSAWIKPAGAMTNHYIIGKNILNQRQFIFRLLTNNIVDFQFYGDIAGTTWQRYYGTTQITDTTKWYHIAVTFDASLSLANKAKIYINGIEETLSLTNAGSPASIQNSTAKLAIGSNVPATGATVNNFYGIIDSVEIYNRVLTYADILSLKYLESNTRKVTHVYTGADIGTAYTAIADVSSQVIFQPDTVDVNCYNFHPFLKQIGNRIWLFFSSNSRDEDKQGSYIRGCYSDNNGISWSSIITVTPSFYGSPNYDADQIAKNSYPVDVIKVVNKYYLIHCVQQSTFVSDVITERTGIGFLSVEFNPITAVFQTPKWIHKVGVDTTYDVADNAADLLLRIIVGGKMYRWTFGIADIFPLNLTAGIEALITESIVYKYDNIYMRLGRGIGGAYTASDMYYQLSNNGIIWGTPIATVIPNAPSLINHLTHSSGKELLLFNCIKDSYARDPLVLAVSSDGKTWSPYKVVQLNDDTPVYSGLYKSGACAYMHSIELSDGSILCAYGVWKEQISVSRFSLP